MTVRRATAWLVAAVLGVGLTAATTLTTTLLADQPIGVAGEPLSAGVALAPRQAPPRLQVRVVHRPPAKHVRKGVVQATRTISLPSSTVPAVTTPAPIRLVRPVERGGEERSADEQGQGQSGQSADD